MKRLTLALLFPLLLASAAAASPVSDCYDRMLAACTGDWGDATYRACIDASFKHCERTNASPFARELDLIAPPADRGQVFTIIR